MNEQMSPNAKKRLEKYNMQQDDWWVVCPVCGQRIEDTLANILAHAEEHKHGK